MGEKHSTYGVTLVNRLISMARVRLGGTGGVPALNAFVADHFHSAQQQAAVLAEPPEARAATRLHFTERDIGAILARDDAARAAPVEEVADRLEALQVPEHAEEVHCPQKQPKHQMRQ